MSQTYDCDSVSSCSDRGDSLSCHETLQGELLPDIDYNNGDDSEQDAHTKKFLDSSMESDIETGESFNPNKLLRSLLQQLVLDLLLGLPAIGFFIYAIFLSWNDGKPINIDPVPTLQVASSYGPTIFPIAFAAVASNLMKAGAAWKLKRGITVLSLELLLGSRTIFSSITSPMSLRAFNSLTPFILALWALSPLGGQAALRVFEVGHSAQEWPFWFLNIHQKLPYVLYQTVMPSAELAISLAAFTTALASPMHLKTASQDVFGHVKVPMIEPYLKSISPGNDGWYEVGKVNGTTEIIYSSLAGIPTSPSGGFKSHANYTFRLQTSYLNTRCSLVEYSNVTTSEWKKIIKPGIYHEGNPDAPLNVTPSNFFSNGRTLLIETKPRNNMSQKPQELVFASISRGTVTNATCQLTTTPGWLGLSPLWGPTPMEQYFTNPDSPFDIAYQNPQISGIADDTFSRRFSQLLNTFWITSVAPFDAINNLTLQEQRPIGFDISDTASDYLKTNGTRTSDTPVLKVHRVWLGILVMASLATLLAAFFASILNVLRRGPDILDFTTRLIRDTPYMNVETTAIPMQNGAEYTRKIRHVRICLGNVKTEQGREYIAIGTMDKVVPLREQISRHNTSHS
ncbi:hypothetical protein EDB80DRAFT_817655 [Ilyonectria destructans]|nr:hypothetical protein EDB80DRAFT_817655 [Ilyonectria destructans]